MNTTCRSPLHRTHLVGLVMALATGALAGCGAEVAGTAAVASGLAATNARQAQAQQAQVVEKFKALQDAGPARAANGGD